jgi:hypothetical protein
MLLNENYYLFDEQLATAVSNQTIIFTVAIVGDDNEVASQQYI